MYSGQALGGKYNVQVPKRTRPKFMIPYYFGHADSSLFGCYHPPSVTIPAPSGVLICYPVGHEYIRSHRLLLQLTKTLNRQGLHVFRFDYFGCGDSAGDFRDARTNRWIEDIQLAIGEFREMAGLDKISLLGLRLGGNLAARASENNDFIKSLVLCDPVVEPAKYLSQLLSMQEQVIEDPKRFIISRRASQVGRCDLLGYEFTPQLRDDIKKEIINPASAAVEQHFIFSLETQTNTVDPEMQSKSFIDQDFKWSNLDYIETALVSPELIRRIKVIMAD